jgi:hypothetical protein
VSLVPATLARSKRERAPNTKFADGLAINTSMLEQMLIKLRLFPYESAW